MGLLTTPLSRPDFRPVFTHLFQRWAGQGEGRTLTTLSRELNRLGSRTTRGMLARFCDATPVVRQPPLWLLLWLCEQTRCVIEFGPDSVRVRALPAAQPPPATQVAEGSR